LHSGMSGEYWIRKLAEYLNISEEEARRLVVQRAARVLLLPALSVKFSRALESSESLLELVEELSEGLARLRECVERDILHARDALAFLTSFYYALPNAKLPCDWKATLIKAFRPVGDLALAEDVDKDELVSVISRIEAELSSLAENLASCQATTKSC